MKVWCADCECDMDEEEKGMKLSGGRLFKCPLCHHLVFVKLINKPR